MKILGIETSSYSGSVALVEDNKTLGETLINTGPRHSERLMVMIDWLLSELGAAKNEIDAVSVSVGPGSFTSLRVGLGIAKGIAYSMGIKISGVSSLDTLAMGVSGYGIDICPLTDARRGEVYSKIFKGSIEGPVIMDERIISVEELCSGIREETIFVGQGADIYRDQISRQLGTRARFCTGTLNIPRASLMCAISHRKLASGMEDNVFLLTPNYIRKSDAESGLQKNLKNSEKNTGL